MMISWSLWTLALIIWCLIAGLLLREAFWRSPVASTAYGVFCVLGAVVALLFVVTLIKAA